MRCTTLLLCLLACREPSKPPVVAAPAPVPVAAPPVKINAESQYTVWLDAFNAADRAKLVAFHETLFPYSGGLNIDEELKFREDTGGFEIKKVEASTATHVEVLVKEHNSDQFARMVVDIDTAEPHKLTKFDMRPIPTPTDFRAPRMTEADTIQALREHLDKLVAADKFAGAVIVAKNGTPIFSNAYGLADRDKKLANTLDTRFRIGSMNKMFTATVIVQLAQAKKLALTDALAVSLPKYPNAELAKQVTIHHLLTHTGGTGDFFGPEFDKHRLELRTLADYVKLYGTRDLAFPPGSKWEYSNYGFLLLGLVIESVTKQNYYSYVQKRLYEPAGMVATSSPIEDQTKDARRSIGYTKEDSADWKPNTGILPMRATSAGGGDSTVKDLLAFANALTNHKLLDADHTTLLTTGKVEVPMGGKYAYGFREDIYDGVRCYGHGGGAPGMNGQLTICDNGYTIAVLANMDPPAAGRIEKFLVDRLPMQ